MSQKIIGVTVGTPTPRANLKQTDPRKADYVRGKDIIPGKVSQLENDAGYLTKHQDISGKLDASKLPEAIDSALAQAKASGEFDGKPGQDGKDGEDGYTPRKGVDYTDGEKGDPGVSITNITERTLAGVKVLFITLSDGTEKSFVLPAGSKGDPGTSVTITKITESSASGGSNIVEFSDGSVLNVKNGKDGEGGSGGGTAGEGGEDGGYYTPAVTQPDANTIRIAFTPSKSDMPPVSEKNIELPAGSPGADGEDGVSPTLSVSKSGKVTTITIKDASGAKTARIIDGNDGKDGYTPVKGKDYFDGIDGQRGLDGQDGYTPVRGTDYWTTADIAEIKSYVDEAILGGAW